MEETTPHNDHKEEQVNPPPRDEAAEKLLACEEARDEYLNGWRRAKADLINYKKEESARAEEVIKFGNAMLIRELLAIVDSFDLAMKSAVSGGSEHESEKNLAPILSQIEALLRRHGVEPLTTVGEKLDPAFHETMSEVTSEKPEGVIVEEVARGWKVYDKVIRPAKVIISKGTTI